MSKLVDALFDVEQQVFSYVYPWTNDTNYENYTRIRRIYLVSLLTSFFSFLSFVLSPHKSFGSVIAYTIKTVLPPALGMVFMKHECEIWRVKVEMYVSILAAQMWINWLEGPAITAFSLPTMAAVGALLGGRRGIMASALAIFVQLCYVGPPSFIQEHLLRELLANHSRLGLRLWAQVWYSVAGYLAAICIEQNQDDHYMEALRSKNQVLAKVSHELRTPLVGIYGAWDLVVQQLGPENPLLKQVEDLVLSCMQDITTLLDDLQAMAKLQLGKGIELVMRRES
jgi:signal transduction histidine kinase